MKNKPKQTLINILINTTKLDILKSKYYFLLKFCKIYSLQFTSKILPKKKKKITLLRSPHIHKKTWKTYLIKTIKLNFNILITSNNNIEIELKISKLLQLLKILSTNSNISIKYIHIPNQKKIV